MLGLKITACAGRMMSRPGLVRTKQSGLSRPKSAEKVRPEPGPERVMTIPGQSLQKNVRPRRDGLAQHESRELNRPEPTLRGEPAQASGQTRARADF